VSVLSKCALFEKDKKVPHFVLLESGREGGDKTQSITIKKGKEREAKQRKGGEIFQRELSRKKKSAEGREILSLVGKGGAGKKGVFFSSNSG